MLKIFHRTVKESKLKEIDEVKAGTWLYMVNPTREERHRAVDLSGLSRDLLKDSLDQFEVPRLESENNVTYVYTRVPLQNKQQITTTPLLIAIGKNFIVTSSKESISFLERFAQGTVEFTTTQRIKFFVQIFSEMNQHYTTLLTDISKRVRSSLVSLEKVSDTDIIQFVYFENVINDFLSALIPTNTILHNLLSGRHLKLYENDEDLIEDLFLSNNQLIEICRSTLKNIVNIRDAYTTIMTQDTNRIIKLLTSITILLTVPTMISSFFGMNVVIPFASHPLSFFMVVSLAAVVVILVLLVFYKKKWF